MSENKIDCYDCNKEINYKIEDVFIMSDIINGEPVSYEAVVCPYCGVTVDIWRGYFYENTQL